MASEPAARSAASVARISRPARMRSVPLRPVHAGSGACRSPAPRPTAPSSARRRRRYAQFGRLFFQHGAAEQGDARVGALGQRDSRRRRHAAPAAGYDDDRIRRHDGCAAAGRFFGGDKGIAPAVRRQPDLAVGAAVQQFCGEDGQRRLPASRPIAARSMVRTTALGHSCAAVLASPDKPAQPGAVAVHGTQPESPPVSCTVTNRPPLAS
jgi:hypothetical protein